MSINNLSDEELLELAQATGKLGQNVYDSGKSSVWNYNKILKLKNSLIDKPPYRVPLDLAYLHYIDWLKEKYPQILPHDLHSFSKEIIQYINHTILINSELRSIS